MAKQATQFLAEILSRTSPPRWLSFLGPSGSGKTMLAKIIFRFIRQHALLFSPGYNIFLTDLCYFCKWPKAIQEMKGGESDTVDMLTEREVKWDQIERLTYAYAVIDDIGQVEDSKKSYLIGGLGRIADARLNSWTVWTANLGLEQLSDQLDKRITSRMLREGNIVVETDAQDFNLR